MSSISFTLYNNHLEDLRQVCPDADDVFVCPICFDLIKRQNISNETVSIGHVWPKYVRQQITSGEANHTVLLCNKCNHNAGRLGDNTMQEHLKARQGKRKTKVSMYPKRMSEPIELYLDEFVQSDNENKFNIKLQTTRRAYQHNKAIKRFRELASNNQIIDFIIAEPYAGIDVRLAQAGWLTSAYLFAFYTFGYRYVFQSAVDPVRERIQNSFNNQLDDKLLFDASKDICVGINTPYSEKPRIRYQVRKIDTQTLDYIAVHCLDFQVRLPIVLNSSVKLPIELLTVPEATLDSEVIGHTPHEDCFWDNIEATYSVVGSDLLQQT